eukprot:4179109-Amphidinium_carterae.1
MDRSIQAGEYCRLTPRYRIGSEELVAYQATCLLHGEEHCNRSLSLSVVGGQEDTVTRMLKRWIVL